MPWVYWTSKVDLIFNESHLITDKPDQPVVTIIWSLVRTT